MKIIIAHPAQQHSYRLASALRKAGVLYKYITTVYCKKSSLTALTARFLKGGFRVKAMNRHCEDLSDRDVVQFCEAEGLVKLLALNTAVLKKQYRKIKYHTADRFARRTAAYAIKSRADAVITYDDTSPLLFEILQKKSPRTVRIMDMSAANILYMRGIYEKDMELSPAFAKRLREERRICWDPDTIERTKRELQAAEYYLVPSAFVGRSLQFSGIDRSKIFYCPYGVDIEEFWEKEHKDIPPGSRPLEFIYVGGVKELKGIAYLLQAFEMIPGEQAFLTVVGKYDPADEDTVPYAGKVNFTGPVLHSEVAGLLRKADVFILPSLGEGMSLSVIEAAACGLPLIVSENAGADELVKEGVNGFVVPIQSSQALIEKIHFFIEHPDRIPQMGREARNTAEQYSWDSYSDQAVRAIRRIMARHKKLTAGTDR